MKNQNVIIYGAGYYGGECLIKMARENIHVVAFVDRSADKITRHYGCDVYTYDEAKKKFSDIPYVVVMNNEQVRDKICENLRNDGIECYPGFDAFYQGVNDVEVDTIKCGESATYQVHPVSLKEDGVAFCFGIGYDYTFEQDLCQKYHMNVYAFDPSLEVVEKMKKDQTPNLKYYPYGLGDMDGKKIWYKPRFDDYSEFFTFWTDESQAIEMEIYQLETLMNKFGYNHLDLLKMDVEGTEFKVLPAILSNLDIDQICIETHARIFPNSVDVMRDVKALFNKNGYCLISNTTEEQTYIKRSLLDI